MTDTPEKLESVFRDIGKVMQNPQSQEAEILGVHLEGPFISPKKLGAQPEFSREFELAEVLSLHKLAPIKIITLSPESEITDADILSLKKENIIIQIGHSDADYET